MVSPERIDKLIIKHRDSAAECVGLWWSLEIVPQAGVAGPVPVTLKAIAVALAALWLSGNWDASDSYLSQFARRLPVYGAIAAAVSAIAFFWVAPVGSFYFFAPVWVGLMAAWFLGVQSFAAIPGPADTLQANSPKGLAGLARAVAVQSPTRRYDIALGDGCIVATLALAGWHYLPGQWPNPIGFGVLIVLVLAASVSIGRRLQGGLRPAMLQLPVFLAVLGGAGGAWFLFAGMPLARGPVVFLLYSALALFAYRLGLSVSGSKARVSVPENIRWILLGVLWVFLFHPFFSAGRHGGGDAVWYSTMLADMIAQVRAGVFPVFSGQSEYEFNGAIYSLRVAPAFHYLGALVDALTLRTLAVFSVQNLTLALVGLGAIGACYFTLSSLFREDRWSAFGLTVLFISCPGVLGIAFNSDLYMSWMTVPFIPLACFGLIRSFERDDLTSAMLVGGSVGIMWWGHSPIAVWMTLIMGAAQGIRLLFQLRSRGTLARGAAGCIVFALVAAYPILSVLGFPLEKGVKMTGFQVAAAGTVAQFIADVFPRVLLPLSAIGRQLSDFQLGYALWLLFAFSLWRFRRLQAPVFRTLLAASAALVLLLTPVPGLDLLLWRVLPAIVRDMTSNWAMNRLYLILASLVVYSGSLALRAALGSGTLRRPTYTLLLVLSCSWSLSEAAKFGKSDPGIFSRPKASSESWPENAMLTSFAYLIFPQVPAYFSHGVVDPQLENRLLSRSTGRLEKSNAEAIATSAGTGGAVREVARAEFVPAPPDEEKSLVNDSPIILAPGKRYLAVFDFSAPDKASGVLEITGDNFARSYALPEYGGRMSFGVGGEHSRLLPLWTSGRESEPLSFRLRRDPPPADANELMPLGSMRLLEYDPEALPIRMESWIPYRARVRSEDPAWLETPRAFQAAYTARVDGHPAEVSKSPEGLTMVAVPAGVSHVELVLDSPKMLKTVFWVSSLAILGLSALGIYRLSI